MGTKFKKGDLVGYSENAIQNAKRSRSARGVVLAVYDTDNRQQDFFEGNEVVKVFWVVNEDAMTRVTDYSYYSNYLQVLK